MKKENDTKRKSKSKSKSTTVVECGGNPMPNNTTDNLNHADARARVLISGLSLLGFKTNSPQRAEIVFVKGMHTDVKMKIYRNGCQNLIWSTDNHNDFPFPDTKNITITVNSAKTGYGLRYEKNPLTDNEDFRRMPSLRYYHGQRLSFKRNAREFITATLRVMDATFYTYKLSNSIAIEHKKRKSNGNVQSIPRGQIGRIMGADIFSDEEELVITIDVPNVADSRAVRLPIEAGTLYTIVVSTTPTNHGYGHLDYVYEHILENPDKYKYDLEFNPREKPWDFCAEENHEKTEKDIDQHTDGPEIKAVQFACECWDGIC